MIGECASPYKADANAASALKTAAYSWFAVICPSFPRGRVDMLTAGQLPIFRESPSGSARKTARGPEGSSTSPGCLVRRGRSSPSWGSTTTPWKRVTTQEWRPGTTAKNRKARRRRRRRRRHRREGLFKPCSVCSWSRLQVGGFTDTKALCSSVAPALSPLPLPVAPPTGTWRPRAS